MNTFDISEFSDDLTVEFILSQNVKKDMSQSNVEHDIALSAEQATLIGWQEMFKKRARDAVRNILGHQWSHVMVKGLGNIGGAPISYRESTWKLVAKGKLKLNRGWPGISGSRYIVWAELRHITTGASIIVHNAHYVAGAWSRKPQTFRKRRQRYWNQGNEKHIQLMRLWIKLGYPIIGMGDYNRMFHRPVGHKILGKAVTYLTIPASIDSMFVVDGQDFGFEVIDSGTVEGRRSDHQGRLGVVRIVKLKGD